MFCRVAYSATRCTFTPISFWLWGGEALQIYWEGHGVDSGSASFV